MAIKRIEDASVNVNSAGCNRTGGCRRPDASGKGIFRKPYAGKSGLVRCDSQLDAFAWRNSAVQPQADPRNVVHHDGTSVFRLSVNAFVCWIDLQIRKGDEFRGSTDITSGAFPAVQHGSPTLGVVPIIRTAFRSRVTPPIPGVNFPSLLTRRAPRGQFIETSFL